VISLKGDKNIPLAVALRLFIDSSIIAIYYVRPILLFISLIRSSFDIGF
jgi:hypothetical protein